MSTLVGKFMEETGYTDLVVTHLGVQKFRRNSKKIWGYNLPEKMLEDFLKWLRQQENV